MKEFLVYQGKTNRSIRCNDGKYRTAPLFGTFRECAQLFTLRGANRVAEKLGDSTPDIQQVGAVRVDIYSEQRHAVAHRHLWTN